MSRNRSPLTQYNRDVVRPGPQRGFRVVVPGGGSSGSIPAYLRIVGSQLIYSGYGYTVNGIKASAGGSSLSLLPVAVPINGSIYADGLGYGEILNSTGSGTGVYAWLCTHQSVVSALAVSTFQQDYGAPKVASMIVLSLSSVDVAVIGGGTAKVYLSNGQL